MAKRLTDIGIRNLKAGPGRREIPAGNGLYVLLQPSGKKGFAVRYRHRGRPRKLTLPAGITLAAARRLAAEAKEQVGQDLDPAAKKQAVRAAAMEAQANTVASVCAAYMKRESAKLRTSDQRESIFRRLVYPAIGERPIDSVRRSDLVAMLDRIEDHNGPRMADVTLAVLRRAFTWYALRTDDFNNPIVRGMGSRHPIAEHRGTRILDDDEIRAVWQATEDKSLFSALVRFLLLTSARRNEAAQMRWAEIDADGIWVLPASRSKTKVDVIRPLSKAALAVLDRLPRIDGCPYPFTSTRTTPLASFSAPKAKLDAASGVVGWKLHDLRRTARSLLSRAGVNSDTAERVLGHSLPGVRATYDRHRYIEEMRHAVEALAALVERIINPPEGEVADMETERKRRRR
jgi:integrase